jgi:F0F1-type ATP synthase assembly protein I
MTRRSLRVQAIVSLALAAPLLLIGVVPAYSWVFGGLAAFLPSVVFAAIVAPRFGTDSANFLRAAVLAESVKWLLTALVCIVVFLGVEPLAAGWFFTGMGLVIVAGWLGLFFGS